MDHTDSLREYVVAVLAEADAHVDAASTLKSFPSRLRGKKPRGSPHTPWQLLEHMRIAQWDILRFTIDSNHVSPKFPEGYWPKTATPPSDKAWQESVRRFLTDLNEMCELVKDPKRDLFGPLPHGEQTLVREALLTADHNAYHLGQLVLLRRIMEGR